MTITLNSIHDKGIPTIYTDAQGKTSERKYSYSSLATMMVTLNALGHVSSGNFPKEAVNPRNHVVHTILPLIGIDKSASISAVVNDPDHFIRSSGSAILGMGLEAADAFGEAFTSLIENGGTVSFDDGSKIEVKKVDEMKNNTDAKSTHADSEHVPGFSVREIKSADDLKGLLDSLFGGDDSANGDGQSTLDKEALIKKALSDVNPEADDSVKAGFAQRGSRHPAKAVSLHSSTDGSEMTIRAHHHDDTTTDCNLTREQALDFAHGIIRASAGNNE